MESFATPYPLFFFDGEHERDKGHVGLHSALTFKRFQAQISQKTGIPANQLSAVFVCKKTFRDTEKRQKLPINENTNFSIILNQHNPSKEKDCHFLVSMKKSKKERKVSRKRSADAENNADDDEGVSSPDAQSSPISPVDWSFTPPESINTEGSENVSAAKVELTLLRRPDTLQYGRTKEKSESDDFVGDLQAKDSSGVVERKNENGSSSTNNHSQPMSLNAQLEEQRKHDMPGTQEIPFGAFGALPERTINQRIVSSQFNVQMPHAELFNQERYGDTLSHVPNFRPNVSYMRNGVVSASYATPFNRASTLSPSFSLSMSPPFSSHYAARMSPPSISSSSFFPSRVPFHNAAAPLVFTARDMNLQRMQAHMLQVQHHEPQVHIPPHNLPRYNPGFCNWVTGINSQGDHQQSLCEVCYDCKRRNINPAPFHWCVQDRVTPGFRGPSPAGPIERPGKRRVQVAA